MLSGKTLKRLLIITTICAVPVVILCVKSGTSAIKNKNALFFPDLMRKPEQITKISLQDHRKILTLQKQNDQWVVVERNNYKVPTAKVEELLYSLADLKIVEPKTTNHEFYKQLDVEDLNDPESHTLLITVNDLYNDSLVKIYIGKREGINLGEEYKEHIFVRRMGEDQTWLVQGTIPLSNEFSDWVEQPLLGIVDSDQIKRVEIDQVKGQKITISKEKPDQEDFVLANSQPKQGMTLDLDTVNTVPFEIAELEFKDVQPANAQVDWSTGISATLETFNGVRLVLQMVKDGDKVLAKVDANALETANAELQQKVVAFKQSKQDWIYVIAPEIYKELSFSQNDFYKPKEDVILEPATVQ